MCFYIDSKYPNKKKAKRDITCYKILRKNWKSIMQGFPYIPKETYLDDNALNLESGLFDTKKYDVIYRGYHSYSGKEGVLQTYELIDLKNKLMIVKCIIPRGSDYYYNSQFHEYVSNKIKITDIIKS